ncbi:MAG: hypothetical protein Q7S44_00760 [bacterium]|nr:hypothetical protein [bacterium]
MSEFFREYCFDLTSDEQEEWTRRTIEEVRSGKPSFWEPIIRAYLRNRKIVCAGRGDKYLKEETEAVEDALKNAFGQHLSEVEAVIAEAGKSRRKKLLLSS